MLLLAEDVIEYTPAFMLLIAGTIAIVSILSRMVTRITIARAREVTRREVAAYVAEGTIDPDHAVAMLEAGETANDAKRRGCC
jgi:hypothetical protein